MIVSNGSTAALVRDPQLLPSMSRHLTLPAMLLVVASGCAGTKAGATCTVATCAPKHRTATIARVAPAPAPPSAPAEPPVPRTETGGVSLTGPEQPYLKRVDPSGWAGHSTPPEEEPPNAIGGGPAAESLEGDEAHDSEQ